MTSDPNTKERRSAVIDDIILSVRRGEDRQYFVGLVGYYVEGIPYSASGLTVDSGATKDIQRTRDGFVCTAIFPPEMLEPATVRAKGTIKLNIAGQLWEVVRVRLEAKLEDIWSVFERVSGAQQRLFFDPETLEQRRGRFPA